MAGKPDLPGVQNVLLYVSGDNFAQAYSVRHDDTHKTPKTSLNIRQTTDYCNGFESYAGYNEAAWYGRGPEGTLETVRCESVRSEAAESSCSSLSSVEDGSVIGSGGGVGRTQEMVVYDSNGMAERNGGVMITVGVPGAVQLPPVVQPSVAVPTGWKRLVNNGEVIYISPSNTALNSLEQVRNYLLTPGTCKCGLECPLKYETVFNFDAKVMSRPAFLTVSNEDLNKLCNHKRKLLTMASAAGHKPLETQRIMQTDNMIRKKRRRIRYSDVPLQQPQNPHEQVLLNQNMKSSTVNTQYQQVWSQSNIQQQFSYAESDAIKFNNSFVEDSRMIVKQQPVPFDNRMQGQPQIQCNSPGVHVISPEGEGGHQAIQFDARTNESANVLVQCQNQDQRIYVNGRLAESGSQTRAALDAVQLPQATTLQEPNQKEAFCNPQEQQQQFHSNIQTFNSKPQAQHYPQMMNPRLKQQPFLPNQPLIIGNHPAQTKMPGWPPNRLPIMQQPPNRLPIVQQQMRPVVCGGRVPPIHQQHVAPISVWTDDFMKKRAKLGKSMRKRPENVLRRDVQDVCPNVDVRQLSGQQMAQSNGPSFIEDPSGYLAQQTALLNSTINGQNGGVGCANYMCPPSSHVQMEQRDTGVPLISNVNMPQQRHLQNYISKNQNEVKQVDKIQNLRVIGITNQQQNQQQCHCMSEKDTNNQKEQNSTVRLYEERVTSSTQQFEVYTEDNSDIRPIQGGTISTSNVSPSDTNSPDKPSDSPAELQSSEEVKTLYYGSCCSNRSVCKIKPSTAVITTMASGRTVSSNTITSVLAGRANTATVTINPANVPISSMASPVSSALSVAKSPLEMVQSVVSSIQVPQTDRSCPQQVSPSQVLVSSGGQLISASTNIMPPPPAKVISNQGALQSVAITSVTTALTQVVPAVGQLGQQAVLVNAVPGSFVLQAGVAMTMDGVQNVQIPHIVTGGVLPQQIQVEGAADPSRNGGGMMVSPEGKKKSRKRKVPAQTVANMLQIAQQNTNMLVSPQGFTQQLHMAHSPQGIGTAPVMQALTIVPGKSNGTAQIVMNSQPLTANAPIGTQQFIQATSQPSQQINLLQPVNLLNGTTGMVQHFPTIQQLIVPNLGGMVMNPDGTATILQDTSNLGVQLQFQNLNGQNILTPVQNNGLFNTGQNILASTAGMVIRGSNTPDTKIMTQPNSPENQFLSPNSGQFVLNGTQFNGQLSPLIANVSPTQVSFNQQVKTNPTQQDFVPQTLMVPCAPPTSNQPTTYVQQNTTIVQQQTTMVANNQNYHQPRHNLEHQGYLVNNPKQQQQVVIEPGAYRQSVSTQTAVNQSVTTNTFCQTSMISASSSPDTTTHSPMACGSPQGSDGGTAHHQEAGREMDARAQQAAPCLAMVHCVSSSKPDSTDLVVQIADFEGEKHELQIYEAHNVQMYLNSKKPPGNKGGEKWGHELLKVQQDDGNENRCSSVFIND